MPGKKHTAAAFTLTEMLIASALSLMVTAMVLTLLVKNLELWRDGMARLQLSEQSRLVRERVLHGLNGRFGLRHARRSQITVAADRVVFYDVTASNAFALRWPAGQPPVCLDQAGTQWLARGGAVVESAAIAAAGNILNIDFSLALDAGRRRLTQPQQIRVYLLNE